MTDRYLTIAGRDWERPPEDWLLAEMFGARLFSPEWFRAYSDGNPRDLNETMDLCRRRIWRPVISLLDGTLIGEHHLKHLNLEVGSGWSSGFIHPKARSPFLAGLRGDEWRACYQVFASWGFPAIFCDAFVDNPPAIAWITDVCGFHRAGCMLHAVPRAGVLQDVVLFSQRQEDIGECIEQAQVLFPDGEFQRDDSAT